MNWRNVKLIFLREVRDQLRDRRTLFMIAVLPLLLYPALGIGMVQLTILFAEQPRTVVLLGHDQLPPPQLLDGNRFATSWFTHPGDAEKLAVITDAAESESEKKKESEHRDDATKILQQARTLRVELEHQKALKDESDRAQHSWENAIVAAKTAGKSATELESDPVIAAARLEYTKHLEELRRSREKIGELFAASHIQVLILVPDGFGGHVERLNRELAERSDSLAGSAKYPRPEIVYNNADDKSQITYNRVKEVLDAWESHILKSQLKLARLPEEFPHPIHPTATDLALGEQIAANLWGKLFPALLVIMAVTGAFYPAVDLCAGEKERGTMETLLICPATRTEIVLGKFFTVMSFSGTTALLNLLSMGMTGRHIFSMNTVGRFAGTTDLSLPGPVTLLWVVVLLVPLSALFSALCLALATFARSSKEGQYYLTPLLMVTMGLTVFCISPGVELNPFYSVMPVVGAALLLKALLLSPLSASPLYLYAAPVLITSLGYSALALWWAIEQFNREEVLFREAERFELALWIKHLLRDKEPTPSFTEAGFCFVLLMLLQFVAMKAFSRALVGAGGDTLIPVEMRVLLIQQLAIVASPALFMGIMLTTSLRRTFRLFWPSAKMLAVAVILPIALHPLTVELAANMQQWFFPPLPESIQGVLKMMASANHPLWLVLICFALAPAVCEELAFRGFMLSGFNRHGRTWIAIGLSSLAFGIMHMIPQQVFNAGLLGLVLGMIALRSNSLLPAVVFHFLYNSLGVLHTRLTADIKHLDPNGNLFFAFDTEGHLRYQWFTLLIAAAITLPLLRWLSRSPADATGSESDARRGLSNLSVTLPTVDAPLPKNV